MDYFTSCIPYKALGYCDSSCFANPSIVRWYVFVLFLQHYSNPKSGHDIPYCATPLVGPDGNYSILACQANKPYGRTHVNLQYKGQTTVGHLPRYLGADGIITYATHTPTSSSLSAISTPSRSSFGLEGDPVLVSSTYLLNKSTDCDSRPYDGISDMSIVPEAAVVAGIIVGALVVLCAVIGFILFLVYRYRRRPSTIHMQADLDMMPLEELEGMKTNNGRLRAPMSVPIRKAKMGA